MNKWKKLKLGDICDINMGQSPESSSYNIDGDGIPFYQGNADFGELYPKLRYYCNKPIKIANKDDILISVRAPIGAINIATEACCIGRGLAAISVKKNLANTKFLYYVLKHKNLELNQKGTGSTFKAINKQNLCGILCKIPPLEIQKHIAKTLDTISELLAMRKQQLAELDNLIMSIFYDMFGDPDKNPYKWETDLLGNMAEIVSGLTKGRKVSKANLVPVPYMRVANVQDGHLNLTDIKQLEVTDAEIKKYKLFNKDLLMTEGGDPDKLGRCAIWNGEIPICIHQNHIFRVRLNQKYVVPEYARCLIGSFYGKRYFLKAAKQTTGIATINSTQLRNFPLLIPNINLQYKFADIFTKIEDQKALVQKAIDETQYLFDSLMSKYFD